MPPGQTKDGSDDGRLTAVEVRLGVVENRADKLEGLTATLVQDQARTTAALNQVESRLGELALAVDAVPSRVAQEVDATESRLTKRLEEQDGVLGDVRDGMVTLLAAADEAKGVADDARTIAEEARVTARKEWPTLAKAVVYILSGILIGVAVYYLTHI